VIGVVALCIFASAAISNADQLNRISPMNMNNERCVRHAEEAIRRGGFNIFSSDESTVFYTSGPYECCTRCMQNYGAVFFYCVGPSSEQARQIIDFVVNSGRWMHN
jgi:hypothetical protein